MKAISLICQPDYTPRSPAVWAKVFPHVGEAGNAVRVVRLERVEQNPWFGDAVIVTSPFKWLHGQVANLMTKNLLGEWTAHNTDGYGIRMTLPWMPRDARILILGTGALAWTVGAELANQGRSEYVYHWGRDLVKAKKVAEAHNQTWMVQGQPEFHWFDLVVNTVPHDEDFNEQYLWPAAGHSTLVNYVWGPDADALSAWQAAKAVSIVYGVGPEKAHGWIIG